MDENLIYFTQTDTTVGFISQNSKNLYLIKERDTNKKFIKVCNSLNSLQNFTRVPKKFKNKVRNSKKITFVYPNNKAIRVIQDDEHLKFLNKIKWGYSSSANKSNEEFNLQFALEKSNIIIYSKKEFNDKTPSKIYKISKNRIKKLR